MKHLVLVMALIGLTACAAGQERAPYYAGEPDYGSMTLDVSNRSGGSLSVYANGERVGTVDASDSCVVIPARFANQGSVNISIKGPAEDPFRLPAVDPYQIDGWTVDVEPWTNTRGIQSMTMRPAPRCDR